VRDIVRVGQDVFGEPAVLGVAAKLRLAADRLPRGQAVFAMAAGGVEPGHADTVAFLDDANAGAERDDDPDTFVARDKGWCRLQRPITIGGVEIGVADAAGLRLD